MSRGEKDSFEVTDAENDELAANLAAIGYEKFSHVEKSARVKSAAEILIAALARNDLDARTVEALPWLILQIVETDWSEVVEVATAKELQNRLGFATSLARAVAERTGAKDVAALLKRREESLAASRLLREDVFCNDSLTETEKRWIRRNRTAEARFWRVLSDLKAEHLNYAD